MRLKLNIAFPGHKAGDVIDLEEKQRIIKDRYWRNRLADSEFDNCVEIVQNVEGAENVDS